MSFKLESANFFEENPSIDVPSEHAVKNIDKRRTGNYESIADDD